MRGVFGVAKWGHIFGGGTSMAAGRGHPLENGWKQKENNGNWLKHPFKYLIVTISVSRVTSPACIMNRWTIPTGVPQCTSVPEVAGVEPLTSIQPMMKHFSRIYLFIRTEQGFCGRDVLTKAQLIEAPAPSFRSHSVASGGKPETTPRTHTHTHTHFLPVGGRGGDKLALQPQFN